MGKTLLILLVGFAASFVILARGKDQHLLGSVDRMVGQFTSSTAKNAAASGAYMALNRLYLTPSWRAGYTNLVLGGDTLTVTVRNDSVGATPMPYRVKINSSARNGKTTNLTQVVVFDRSFNAFAVWAKDTVISVTTLDSLGVVDPNLRMQKAPFMPKINKDSLVTAATAQGHLSNYGWEDDDGPYSGGGHFHPSHGFPNGSFYYDSTAISQAANVIYIQGDLHIRDNRTIYGIYVVEGNVLLNENASIKGVLYLPNPTSRVYNRESAGSQITGGIVTWGRVDGRGYPIVVRHQPRFLRELVSNYAPNNPPIRVLSWK
ncbi:MAG: hypothetical protein ONB46_05380 [candidate division KSB1 bacterium]|nr:hypothetical protein [candidate division KSB1 bacterium]MDZ7365462.1 hypothetical protein [candidate division KSB1 bacterium]MDZ7403491.1 hypothetical protein [candidate division KSB1 bacterium]